MAIRIQLRRDTAANWVSSNPVLRQGEMGIETDTLQIKLGDGTSTWTQITGYMNLVPDGSLTIGDYVLVNDIGAAEGVVGLDINKNAIVTGSSIIIEGGTNNAFETTLSVTDPTADRTITFKNADGTVAFVADIPTTTDALTEGSTNKYFSAELAQDAIADALAAGSHTNITVTYNDVANSISLSAAPGYVDEQAVDAVAAALAAGTHTNITVGYNDAGNAISLTGAVTYTDENAQDAVGNAVGTGLSYNDTTGAISVDNTIATKTYADNAVSTGISNLVASSPATLDTLNELATALGNDANFSTTITNSIATKAPTASPTFTGTVSGITKSMVGLDNVDNTSDANKPVSTATQTALDLKAPLASPTFTGTVSGVTATMVGLGNVDNTTDANKPVSTATQTALDLKVDESLFDAKGDLLVASADNTPAKLTVGTNGYLLTANSAATNGVEWAAAPISLPTQTGNSGKYLTTDGSAASWGTLVVPITTGISTVSANTATTVDTTVLSAFTSIEYMVSLKQGSKIRTSKVVVQTDGTSVDMTEFAITETGGTIAGVVVSVAVSSTNAVLQLTATDATSTNVTVKFSKVAL